MESKSELSTVEKIGGVILITVGCMIFIGVGVVGGKALAEVTQQGWMFFLPLMSSIMGVFYMVDWFCRKCGEGGLSCEGYY